MGNRSWYTIAVTRTLNRLLDQTAMHNVELKAELRDFTVARAICQAIGATFIMSFAQTDTYYKLPAGRLKRRETQGEPVEYVFYERTDRATPKLSKFTLFSEEQALERFGRLPMPVWVTVQKTRELWLIGPTRIHLDHVERLGTFLEFESLVSKENNVARAHEHISWLRDQFRPVLGELIDCSYSDMLDRELADQGAGQRLLPPS